VGASSLGGTSFAGPDFGTGLVKGMLISEKTSCIVSLWTPGPVLVILSEAKDLSSSAFRKGQFLREPRLAGESTGQGERLFPVTDRLWGASGEILRFAQDDNG